MRVQVDIPSLPANSGLLNVRLAMMDNIRLGQQRIEEQLVDLAGNIVASGTFLALATVDGAEPNTPLETIPAGLPGFTRVPNIPYNAGGCSALDASCVGRSPLFVDALLTGFIDEPGDVDWYQIQVVRAGSRITADLTNLPFDADLVLYGPAGLATAPSAFPNAQDLPGRFVEDPGLGVGQAARAVAAEALTDLQLDQGFRTRSSATRSPATRRGNLRR